MVYRGQGSADSFLNAGPGEPVCCLGNLLQQEHIPTDLWSQEVLQAVGPAASTAELDALLAARDPMTGLSMVYRVYDANDRVYVNDVPISDAERVAKINAITEPFGFRFEFKEDQ